MRGGRIPGDSAASMCSPADARRLAPWPANRPMRRGRCVVHVMPRGRRRWRAVEPRRRGRWRAVEPRGRGSRRRIVVARGWRRRRCVVHDGRRVDVLDAHGRADVFDNGGLRCVDDRWWGRGRCAGRDGRGGCDGGEAEDACSHCASVSGLSGRCRKNEACDNCRCQKACCGFDGLVHGVLLSLLRK